MSTSIPARDETFLREAIQLAAEHSQRRDGGPFGAIVVREGIILSRGWNQVTSANDPTAHAEVMAIRTACRELSNFR
jgi:tRNA(Arg) A34 adenosine deaminase TadA